MTDVDEQIEARERKRAPLTWEQWSYAARAGCSVADEERWHYLTEDELRSELAAAIETLRELLLHRAKVNADSSRAWSAVNHQLRADYAELADSAERRACIAIALALLL